MNDDKPALVSQQRYPMLDYSSISETRKALHSYSQLLGAWLKSVRKRRKHWWHASLRPSVAGMTTGVVRANVNFEIELDLQNSRLAVRDGFFELSEPIVGQSAADLAGWLDGILSDLGISATYAPGTEGFADAVHPGYSGEVAKSMHGALMSIAGALENLRAGIREETSPIQVWPHHFDLSMIWLPGPKISGEDPANEEYADKQMNFGFVFGDAGIEQPYLYITGYPLPASLPAAELPHPAVWRTDGFDGVVLRYADLVGQDDPDQYLQGLWGGLMHIARPDLCDTEQQRKPE